MKAKFDEIILEVTGLLADRAFSARRWRQNPYRLEWAYGATEEQAYACCEVKPNVILLADVEALIPKEVICG